ncbi:MAG: AAA family ATPase [Christensenellaceae bacterium]|jgi:predicted AAA+ superfamily ATPase|nr:AAA family ATPase [Christensenellaceae bacterium]
MKRTIEERLFAWKNKKDRMPLIVFGARQVGKTYTIFHFGKSNFKDVVVLTFEGNTVLQKIFDLNLDPVRIIHELESFSLKKIDRDTLVFFDEVQACKNALTSLKYFYEQMPEQPIIAAGSLLGVALTRGEFSFPVGKVDRLTMYPLAFDEFLNALGEDALLNVITDCFKANTKMHENLHERALLLYQEYLIVGGMPKVVDEYINKRDFDFVRVIQQNIILGYLDDMSKYSTPAKANKTRAVYNSIPYQLARENKKFIYQLVNSSARAVAYEEGILWLNDGGLIVRVNKANEGKAPLYFYQDALSYKIYMNDVGLLTAKSNIAPALITSTLGLGGEAKGAITENYIVTALVANGHSLYYWESNGKAEVDFLVEIGGLPIPIEAKSADNVKAKSLGVFISKYEPPYSIRISSKNFGFENNIKSMPLYAAFCIKP